MVGIGQDITERKAQEEEYVKLIDTANAPIFGIDINGHVNEWNKKAAQITGFTREDVMGHDLVQEFITPDYRESVKRVLDRALEGHETANFEFPLMTKMGTRVEVLLNATTRQDAHGVVNGMVGIGQDITSLMRQRHEYQSLVQNAHAPIFGVDTLGVINVWNPHMASLTNMSEKHTKGKKLLSLVSANLNAGITDTLTMALEGICSDAFTLTLHTDTKDAALTLLVSASPSRDLDGSVVGVVLVGTDYTAHKKNDDARRSFLASFSHELRTPLHGILGMLSNVTNSDEMAGLSERAQGWLHMTGTCGKLLLNLVNDILDLSKFESGQLESNSDPFDLHASLTESLELASTLLMKKPVELLSEIEVSVPRYVRGDEQRFRQVILNLLTNAVKFTSSGSIKVRCWVATPEEEAEIAHAMSIVSSAQAKAESRKNDSPLGNCRDMPPKTADNNDSPLGNCRDMPPKADKKKDDAKSDKTVSPGLTNTPNSAGQKSPCHWARPLDQSSCICIDVEDTGIGMLPGDCEKIFDIFWKNNEKGMNNAGSGLGLAICRRLMEVMGGRIRCVSEVGVGSTFKVVLRVGKCSEGTAFGAGGERGGSASMGMGMGMGMAAAVGSALPASSLRAHARARRARGARGARAARAFRPTN
jgi:PAS domain S-box-containing protein